MYKMMCSCRSSLAFVRECVPNENESFANPQLFSISSFIIY
jgi:hypothetical protein